MNLTYMPFSRRRRDPFYDKGKERQREPPIYMAADQVCLQGLTL